MTEIDQKQVEKVYKIVKDKANKFSKEELELAIIADGYSKDIAKAVIQKIHSEKEIVKTNPEDKEKILAEISKSLKEAELKPPKKQNKKSVLKKTRNFFQKIYYFCEDKYYSMIDGIDKIIPISKVTDSIDKAFPSFVLFIILIIGLIFLIIFGISTFSGSRTIEVSVTDILDVPISGAKVVLSINDVNHTIQTDTFGTAWFDDFKYKRNKTKLIIEKSPYKTETRDLKLKGGTNSIIVKLDVDASEQLYLMEPRTRTIIFKENSSILATKKLNIVLRCSNTGTVPEPNVAEVNNGQLTVDQVRGCGDLRIDVSSEFYDPIQNMVVPENNTIMLNLKSNNSGKLDVFVKDQNTQQAISGVVLQIFRPDDITTSINESNLPLPISATTDTYGRFLFTDLSQGNYTISLSKDGYVVGDRFGPYQVLINNTTIANINLFQGNAVITVILVDSNGNTTREIKGDITLYKRQTDSNSIQSIGYRADTNQAIFNLQHTIGTKYRIGVSGTEMYGYFHPTPIDVNNFDGNETIIIPLEYSSVLNTGKIGVNVTMDNEPITRATVYLYEEDEYDIPVTSPAYTNTNGDCNFYPVRAQRDYYAFSISDSLQGESEVDRLDVNDFLRLEVDLQQQAKVLNLKVNINDYNISFYDNDDDEISNYSRIDVNSTDSNKEYVFRGSTNEIYAIISAFGKGTYQTDIITLIPGQKVYKQVNLTNSRSTAYSDINFLGVYDQTGTIKLDSIDLANDLGKTLKFKFQLSTTNKNYRANSDSAMAYIREGNALLQDIIKLKTVFAPGADRTFGCRFSGETASWNYSHYLSYFNLDHSGCQGTPSGFKWTQLDFSDSEAEQIEFSVNFEITGISQPSDYVIYYKGLTQSSSDNFVLSPALPSSWNNCNIVPRGYFYSPYKFTQLQFDNDEYGFTAKLYDYNFETQIVGALKEKNGSRYELNIGSQYYYAQKLICLEYPGTSGQIQANSTNTGNNLIYRSYRFRLLGHLDPIDQNINATVNAPSYNINEDPIHDRIDVRYGSELDHNAIIKINDFFNPSASISTNLFNIESYNPFNLPVLSYTNDDIFIQIITGDVTGSNDIYAGDNNISFRITDRFGVPMSNKRINATVLRVTGYNNIRYLGTTDSSGWLRNINMSFSKTDTGFNIKFTFSSFPGLPNNQITRLKQIKPGYKLVLENGSEITSQNPILYLIGKYNKAGVPTIIKEKKTYRIIRTTGYVGQLTNVDIYQDDVEGNGGGAPIDPKGGLHFIDLVDITNYIYNTNNNIIPTNLTDSNKQIKTIMSLLSIPDTNQVTGGYHNIINIGNSGTQPIILGLDANLKTLVLFDINMNTEIQGIPKPGIRQKPGGPLIVELIKGKSPNVNFNYVVTNDSNIDVVLTIDKQISSDINNYITVTAQGTTIPRHNTRTITINYGLQPSAIINQSIKAKPVTINFNYNINGATFTESLQTEVNLFDINNSYSIAIDQPQIQNMSCSSTNCSMIMPVAITNNTQTYDLNISNIRFVDADTVKIKLQSANVPTDLNANWQGNSTKSILLNIDGNYSALKPTTIDFASYILTQVNKTLTYTFKIYGLSNSNFDRNVSTRFDVAISMQSLEQTLEDNGLFGNICLGVGSINVNSDTGFYILGNCDIGRDDDCLEGPEAKPKILYKWDNSITWSEECISSVEDGYDVDKTHCDSAQMLFSVLTLVDNIDTGETGDAIGDKYIYLMSDGVSKDLLKDIITDNSFFATVNYSWGQNIITVPNVDSDQFSIRKVEIDSTSGLEVDTLKPGKYEIIVDNFIMGQSTSLNIKLKLVREMPYTMKNLLYYMPIDGKLGVIGNGTQTHPYKLARNGYGTTLDTTLGDANVAIIKTDNPQNDVYLYRTTDGNKSRTIINLENDENNLSKTLRYEGKLLDLTLTGIDDTSKTFYISTIYSPSYPIPIYAKVVNSNNNGLSYKVKNAETGNTIPIDAYRFLVWSDYDNEGKILNDGQYVSSNDVYQKSVVDSSVFRSNYGTDNSIKLLKTIMYWPVLKDTANFTKYKLYFTDGDTLDNDSETKIYTLANIDANGSTIDSGIFSQLSRIPYSNITLQKTDVEDMFNNINTNKACIRGGLTVTTIRWVNDENIEFTQEQIDQIIADSNVGTNQDNDNENGDIQN